VRSLAGFVFDVCLTVKVLAVESVRAIGHFVDDALDAWGSDE